MTKKKDIQHTIEPDTYEEAILYNTEVETEYGENHDQRISHHEKRRSSRPHRCVGPQCEDVFKDPKHAK